MSEAALPVPHQDVVTPYRELGIATTGYEPREQFVPFHMRDKRWSCLVCHRRAGKTVACINEVVTRAMYTPKKNARYAYIAPFYRQAKDVAWQYLKEATGGFAVATRESELRIILPNGAWITLYGADNIDALRGLYLDGVILDEYGDCRPGLWGEVILPTLADRKGWAVFIGTPKGNNHFKATYDRAVEENWFVMRLTATASGILDEDEMAELKKQMTKEEWEQEMECSFQAALRGAYYGEEIAHAEAAGRITTVPWNPELPVLVASDLGYADSTALWFWQVTSDGLAIIDYEEAHSKTLPYYFDLLDAKGYQYETIWLPHDAKSKTLQTGRSTIEQFLEQKNPDGTQKYPVKLAPKLDVQDGINAARKVLPLCHFDQKSTYDGVESLKAYRREFDVIKRSFSDKPRHDWASHGADAFRYLALVTRKPMAKESAPEEKQLVVKGMGEYTFDELLKMHNEGPKLRLVSRRRI